MQNSNIYDLIDRYNLLGSHLHLDSLSIDSGEATNWKDAGKRWSRYDHPLDQWTEEAQTNLFNELEELPSAFTDYIWGNSNPRLTSEDDHRIKSSSKLANYLESLEQVSPIRDLWYPTVQAVSRYEGFLELRLNFDLLVDFVFRHPSWEDQIMETKRGFDSQIALYLKGIRDEDQIQNQDFELLLSSNARVKINKTGSTDITLGEFSRAIIGIDVKRIRRCPACENIFWAERVDRFCCSKECNGRLHTRLNRSEDVTDQKDKLLRPKTAKKNSSQKVNRKETVTISV